VIKKNRENFEIENHTVEEQRLLDLKREGGTGNN
jgi:hypothetical protein